MCATVAMSGWSAQAQAEFVNRTNFSAWKSADEIAPTVSFIAQGEQILPILGARSEEALLAAIARYEIVANRGGWPTLNSGQTLARGSSGPAVETLRYRLSLEGYLPAMSVPAASAMDEQLVEAVQRFQRNHGLMVSGRVDEATRRALNVPVEARLKTLRANLPRVQQYVKGLGDRYVIVNIPGAQLETVENGYVYSRHNAIAGMLERPTPVVLSQIDHLVFNPYWTAPESIVRRDIIPEVRKDPGFLRRMNIRIFDGWNGPEVDPKTVDWDTVAPNRYVFRQDPGENNAMASVKIHFPNNHLVYLHDTPTRNLFSRAERFFSSGCVRVDDVHVMTEWLVKHEPDWDRRRIEALIASGEENYDLHLSNPIPLRLAYLTAWATPDGNVHFRPDFYELDDTGFVVGQPDPVKPEQNELLARDMMPDDSVSAGRGDSARESVATDGWAATDRSNRAWIQRHMEYR